MLNGEATQLWRGRHFALLAEEPQGEVEPLLDRDTGDVEVMDVASVGVTIHGFPGTDSIQRGLGQIGQFGVSEHNKPPSEGSW